MEEEVVIVCNIFQRLIRPVFNLFHDLLDGAVACFGGLTFASKMLVSIPTIAVRMGIAVQQSRNHRENFGEKEKKPYGLEGL